MSAAPASALVPDTLVVVDTDAFSHLFVRGSGSRVRDLRESLRGRIPVIATQTYAELLAWPRLQSWGATRTASLAELLSATTTVPVSGDVVTAYVDLFVACRSTGHALHQKVHAADRWVAATAIALDRPLLSFDGVFTGAPGLLVLSPPGGPVP